MGSRFPALRHRRGEIIATNFLYELSATPSRFPQDRAPETKSVFAKQSQTSTPRSESGVREMTQRWKSKHVFFSGDPGGKCCA